MELYNKEVEKEEEVEINNNNSNGGNGMDGTNTFGISDILLGRGLGLGYGGLGGVFGGGYPMGMGIGVNAGYGAPYANLATIQHGINHSEVSAHNDAVCNREVYSQGLNNALGRLDQLQVDNKFENTNTNMAAGFTRICDRLNTDNTNNIIMQGNNMLQLTRELAAVRAEAAAQSCSIEKEMLKCCCETQKMIVSENAATRELINQNTIRAAVDQNNINATVGAINAAAAQNTAALVAAIQSIGRHCH